VIGNGGYEHDVFVSYRRHLPISQWVNDYFYDELSQWLASAYREIPRVFVDTDGIETGDSYPKRLRRELLRSAFLVPVWSPSYFESGWCVAELRSMMAREQALQMRTDDNPEGLVLAVKFQKGDYVPDYASEIQCRDYSEWALTAPAFRNSPLYLDFQADVKAFTALIAERLGQAPPWQSDWPIETPDVNGGPSNPTLPRL
jgi:TIR domain